MFGGVYNNEKVSNDLWVFDAILWTQVTTTGDIPPPVNEHSSCVADDRMYVYGGNDFQELFTAHCMCWICKLWSGQCCNRQLKRMALVQDAVTR